MSKLNTSKSSASLTYIFYIDRLYGKGICGEYEYINIVYGEVSIDYNFIILEIL